jgi:hypothetical protein
MARTRPIVTVVVPFVVGVVAAPYVKPWLRSAARASIGAGFKLRVMAAEVASDYQDLAAEEAAKQNGARETAPDASRSV